MRAPLQFLICVLCALATPIYAIGQRSSATPLPAVLVRATPVAAALATAATIPPTDEPLPAVRLEALASAGEVNARALPDVESELLGVIAHGTAYRALRVYYRWYEFRYDLSPSGRAWVYGDLVSLEGDSAQLEVIENFADIAAGERAIAEEEDRTIEVATSESDSDRGAVVAASRLPRFTPPPATQAPYADQLRIAEAETARATQLPPVAPIIALGGLGLLGLLVSLLRRP